MTTAAAMRRGWWGRSLVLVMVLVAVALGFCVFDGADHDGQGTSPDLCLGLLSVSFGASLLVGPLLEGWATDTPMVPFRTAWTTVLAPPPRSL
jgi:hypothetical protein